MSSLSVTSSRRPGPGSSRARTPTCASSRSSCRRPGASFAPRNGLVIAETRHGFVCASAGVDHSNAAEPGTVILLPLDPDASARRIRGAIRERTGLDVVVVVTDSFGRPFRQGTTDVAIGVAGLGPLRDLRGTPDRAGVPLRTSQVAVADELAAAANLVRSTKADGLPVVVVRGLAVTGDGSRDGARHPGGARPVPIGAASSLSPRLEPALAARSMAARRCLGSVDGRPRRVEALPALRA